MLSVLLIFIQMLSVLSILTGSWVPVHSRTPGSQMVSSGQQSAHGAHTGVVFLLLFLRLVVCCSLLLLFFVCLFVLLVCLSVCWLYVTLFYHSFIQHVKTAGESGIFRVGRTNERTSRFYELDFSIWFFSLFSVICLFVFNTSSLDLIFGQVSETIDISLSA